MTGVPLWRQSDLNPDRQQDSGDRRLDLAGLRDVELRAPWVNFDVSHFARLLHTPELL